MGFATPEGWPRPSQRWKREGEPIRIVHRVFYPGDFDPGVYFTVQWGPQRRRFVCREDWDEWLWWASDAKLLPVRSW